MKTLTATLLFLLLIIKVSVAQIPNNGFETWNNMGAYNNPGQWGTMNNKTAALNVFTAEKGSPGNPGSFYLKLTSKNTPGGVANGIAVSGKLDTINKKPISGFAFNLRPQSLIGNWLFMTYGSSPGGITATLTKWNSGENKRDTIAIANQTLGAMQMSWIAFTINFSYQSGDYPDSCIIFIRASGVTPHDQDYLYVDDLKFSGSVAGIENNASSQNEFSVFPNPSNNQIIIELNVNSSAQTIIKLTDMNGNVVLTKDLGIIKGSSKQTLDISGLAKGSYLVNINTEKGNSVKMILIQ